ncbi:MAG: 30S ribosomal protein S9 [Candidatus Andersenbacteria bacterium CG10_big_fil_rev_8_21_14_0_10_54_11]|uniref:Small ribosomal subunit protein uS9 n=1 Tax=Candidatus Andersenbacteria bacterium CG10_big_fil_rev_8_21_14_0_10_54_11 TaxID=1974485 RepID=A0A2M6WYG0_9BACT|nr:MAG: 30S ribosomal protein S9 [Candidatus Andersenbacteria bacterium CG10_big_fil_rev_8_21_14_0_10_54_11]
MKTATQRTGLGRRKSSTARVRLVDDPKRFIVNEKPLHTYFPTFSLQQRALAPLQLTSQHETLGLEVRVSGGGSRGQADAVRLGVARALLVINPAWRKQLKDAGMLTRDGRVKERKKFGLKRARRAPQFSKR